MCRGSNQDFSGTDRKTIIDRKPFLFCLQSPELALFLTIVVVAELPGRLILVVGLARAFSAGRTGQVRGFAVDVAVVGPAESVILVLCR